MRKLRLILLTTVLTTQIIIASGQSCKKLADGQYNFKHTTKGHKKADFVLTITGGTYYIVKDGQRESGGKIEWWTDNCMFKLNGEHGQETKTTDSTDTFQKTFQSNGGTCYELTGENKFRLTYCGNLHITLSEGRIISR